jgi:hypothetical protein
MAEETDLAFTAGQMVQDIRESSKMTNFLAEEESRINTA